MNRSKISRRTATPALVLDLVNLLVRGVIKKNKYQMGKSSTGKHLTKAINCRYYGLVLSGNENGILLLMFRTSVLENSKQLQKNKKYYLTVCKISTIFLGAFTYLLFATVLACEFLFLPLLWQNLKLTQL